MDGMDKMSRKERSKYCRKSSRREEWLVPVVFPLWDYPLLVFVICAGRTNCAVFAAEEGAIGGLVRSGVFPGMGKTRNMGIYSFIKMVRTMKEDLRGFNPWSFLVLKVEEPIIRHQRRNKDAGTTRKGVQCLTVYRCVRCHDKESAMNSFRI